MNRNIISVNYQNIFCIRCLFPAMLCTHDSNRFQFQYLACIHTNNVTFKALIYFIYDPLWGAARALFVRHHFDVICNQHQIKQFLLHSLELIIAKNRLKLYAKIYCYTKNKNVIEISMNDVYTIYHCICQNIRIIVYLQMIRHVNKIYLTHVSSKSVVALTSDTQVEIKTLWCCTSAGGMNSTT